MKPLFHWVSLGGVKNLNFFWCTPFGCLYFLSFLILNEPGLDAGIDPGMALTPLPSSIGRGSIPRPSNRECNYIVHGRLVDIFERLIML